MMWESNFWGFSSSLEHGEAVHHHTLLDLYCIIIARKELIEKATNFLVKLNKLHNEGLKATVKSHTLE